MKSSLVPVEVKDDAGNNRLINLQISYHIQDNTILFGIYAVVPIPVATSDMNSLCYLESEGLKVNGEVISDSKIFLKFSNRFIPIYVGQVESELEIRYVDYNQVSKVLLSRSVATPSNSEPGILIQSDYTYDHYIVHNTSDIPYIVDETWYDSSTEGVGLLLGTSSYTLHPGDLRSRPTLCRSNLGGLKVILDVYTNPAKNVPESTLIHSFPNVSDTISIEDYTLKYQYFNDVRKNVGILKLDYPDVDLKNYKLAVYYYNEIKSTGRSGEFIQVVDNIQGEYVTVKQEFAPVNLGYCAPPVAYVVLMHKATSEVHYVLANYDFTPIRGTPPDKFFGLTIALENGLLVFSDPSHDYTSADKKLFTNNANNCLYSIVSWTHGEYDTTKKVLMNRETLDIATITRTITTRTGTVITDPWPHYLNIRKAPNTTSQILGTFRRGQTFVILETVNATSGSMKFHKLEYNGRFGYVSADWVRVKTTTSQTTETGPRVWNIGGNTLVHRILKDLDFDSNDRYAIIVESKNNTLKYIVKGSIV